MAGVSTKEIKMEAIRDTGKLETDTENALKAALDELVAQLAS